MTGSAFASDTESPSADASATPSADDRAAPPTEASAAAHHGSVFVDPLGFLLFGPTFGVEAGSGRISGTLYGRWLSAGVLAHSLFLKDNESFALSYGLGIRGRYFFHDDLSGPHLGVGAELVHTRIDDSVNLVATKSTYVAPLFSVIQVDPATRSVWGSFTCDSLTDFTNPTGCTVAPSYFFFDNCTKP
ncbi:MAG TPA: hypothetical protein VNW92_02575 [Polyangiaceae bacterium]|nr:hypothetical protein [Polyangiaceae bacterium]